jgi:hypothetical protein
MPTVVGSSGKFGTSMDYSQMLEMKRRYKTVQRQNTKPVKGDQTAKPAFNKDQVGGGQTSNGAMDYYVVKGLSTIYKRQNFP